jgi:hypothetical protein
MRLLIIDLFCFVVIEMVELLMGGGGAVLYWGLSQYFKLCLIYTLLVAV